MNCAASETEQNLVAFQFRGQIYYRSFKAVPAGKSKWIRYVNCAASETEQSIPVQRTNVLQIIQAHFTIFFI